MPVRSETVAVSLRLGWRALNTSFEGSTDASACADGLETIFELARCKALALVVLAAEDADRSYLRYAACLLASALVGMSLLFALRNLLTIHSVRPVAEAAPATPVHTVVSAGPSTIVAPSLTTFLLHHMRFNGESEHRPASSIEERGKSGFPTQWLLSGVRVWWCW